MYIKNKKYNGEDDNFNFKFTIFHYLYSRANISQEVKVKAYPIILRGLALNYYYTNLKNATITLLFNQICNTTYYYFKGPKYRYSILGQ